MPSTICCICGTQTSKRWHQPYSYRDDFEPCFGVNMNLNPDQCGNSTTLPTAVTVSKLCDSCRADVRRFRNVGKTKFDKPNSKMGKIGKPGHKSVGGLRTKSPSEVYVDPPTPCKSPLANSIGCNTDIIGDQLTELQNCRGDLCSQTSYCHLNKRIYF